MSHKNVSDNELFLAVRETEQHHTLLFACTEEPESLENLTSVHLL